MARPSFCRDCGKLVEFHPTAGGKMMPIDPDPHPEGTFGFNLRMQFVRMPPGTRPRMYRSHFETCTKAGARGMRALARPEACDHDGCEMTGPHRHCFRCDATDHLATECPEAA